MKKEVVIYMSKEDGDRMAEARKHSIEKKQPVPLCICKSADTMPAYKFMLNCLFHDGQSVYQIHICRDDMRNFFEKMTPDRENSLFGTWNAEMDVFQRKMDVSVNILPYTSPDPILEMLKDRKIGYSETDAECKPVQHFFAMDFDNPVTLASFVSHYSAFFERKNGFPFDFKLDSMELCVKEVDGGIYHEADLFINDASCREQDVYEGVVLSTECINLLQKEIKNIS